MEAVLERGWRALGLHQQAEFVVVVGGTFLVHELSWLLFNAFYMVLDELRLLQHHKLQPERRLASEVIWFHFWALLRGHVLLLLPVIAVGFPIIRFFGISTSAAFPTLGVFALQMVVFNVLEDTGFYWVHRLMHKPWWYVNFHKVHHEFTAPTSLTGEVAHPVEFALNFVLPLMVGPVLCGLLQGVHPITFWAWLVFRELRSTDSHSGYNLPWHPLRLIGFIYGGPKMHDFHHMPQGKMSNYGGYKVWDWLCGTDQLYAQWLEKKKKKKEGAQDGKGKQKPSKAVR